MTIGVPVCPASDCHAPDTLSCSVDAYGKIWACGCGWTGREPDYLFTAKQASDIDVVRATLRRVVTEWHHPIPDRHRLVDAINAATELLKDGRL
jgi:hypothetical protein